MYVIRHLLHPQRQSLINRWKKATKAERSLIIGFSISGALFWLGLSGLMFFFIHTFHGVEIVGTIVLRKLIELLLLSTFGLLCFSNVVTALSNYYLSDDLELLLSLPISKVNFFLRSIRGDLCSIQLDGALFAIPIFISYGIVYGQGLNIMFSLP